MRSATITLLCGMIFAGTGCDQFAPQDNSAESDKAKSEESLPASEDSGLEELRQAFIDDVDGKTLQYPPGDILRQTEIENVEFVRTSESEGKEGPIEAGVRFVRNTGTKKYLITGKVAFKESEQGDVAVWFEVTEITDEEYYVKEFETYMQNKN